MKRRLALVFVLLVMSSHAPSYSSNVFGEEDVIVAVLDSGIRATHQEFDYRGPHSQDDQLVAWFDFTEGRRPATGQLWDDVVIEPDDEDGHGTGVASLAVGLNRAEPDRKDASFAPGAKLAVGRVCTPRCSFAAIEAAIDWAVDTVGADVINLSIGTIVPAPEALAPVQEPIERARAAGTLVVVGNGNGFGNVGGPLPAWSAPPAASPDVLAVGAAGEWGYTVSIDPEVTAKFGFVFVASTDCDACYRTQFGTSFSSPLVAGMAASAIAAARDAGAPHDPARIEQLLKYSARDTLTVPPTIEGYGELDADQFRLVMHYASTGGLPRRLALDLAPMYENLLGEQLRHTWSNRLDGDLASFHALPAEPGTGRGRILASTVTGVTEGELYRVELAPGERLAIDLAHEVPSILDRPAVTLYRGEGPSFDGAALVDREWPRSRLSYRSPRGGVYTAVVGGAFAPLGETYLMEAETSDESSPEPAFNGEYLYATTTPPFAR